MSPVFRQAAALSQKRRACEKEMIGSPHFKCFKCHQIGYFEKWGDTSCNLHRELNGELYL